MKVKVIESQACAEDEIIITVNKIDDDIIHIAKYAENYGINIIGYIENVQYVIPLRDIFYFEAVDNHVFAYSSDKVYQVNYKIASITEQFSDFSFIQTSRTIVLNIDKIDHVLTLINGRILAVLVNKEKQIITRAYAQMFRDIINQKGAKK